MAVQVLPVNIALNNLDSTLESKLMRGFFMRNLILFRKVIVLILVNVLLAFGIQGIGYSQSGKIMDEQTRYVVWIVTRDGSGSGVLIDKTQRLVVTNAHVVNDDKEVEVFFAARDSAGNIIRARPFYKNQGHRRTLERLGFVTRGRVIAKNDPETAPDLALVQLDGLPETTKAISVSRYDYSTMEEEAPLTILGHPQARPLWQMKAGHFRRYDEGEKDLWIFADAYFGNSGGPVLQNNKLIGVARAIIKDEMITIAVPTSAIVDLRKTLKPVRIFSIYNNTDFPMSYEIQWEKGGAWEPVPESLEPKEEKPHPDLLPREEGLPAEYPKIRFKKSPNSKESAQIEQSLKTKSRYLGRGIKNVENHIEVNDARRYQFEFDSQTEEISLKELKLLQAFSIRNNTQEGLSFEYTWNEDHEWKGVDIQRNSSLPVTIMPRGNVSTGYPLIRFNEDPEVRHPPQGSEGELLETYIGYFDKDTPLKDIFDDLSEVPPILYQLELNSETNKVFLDKLERTQKFSIQNASKSVIYFEYKWQEGDSWERSFIFSNRINTHSRRPEKVSEDYPKIRFSVNNDIIWSEGPNTLEKSLNTQIGYFDKDGKKIEGIRGVIDVEAFRYKERRGYHFKFDPKTQKISFHEGFLDNRSFFHRLSDLSRSYPYISVALLVTLLIINAVIIITEIVFPNKHIFSIRNDTESTVNYYIKWTKIDDWEGHSLEPDELCNQWWTGFFGNRPQIRFDQIVNGEKETKELRLETKAQRFGRNADSKIDREHARKYHFDSDPETNVIDLYDSEKE